MKIFKLNNTITALGCSIRLLITDLTKQKKLLVNYKIWNFKLFGQRRKRKKNAKVESLQDYDKSAKETI